MIKNSEQCQNVIQTMLDFSITEVTNNSKLSPVQECSLYENYNQVLNYAIEKKEFYHLYDVWSVLKKLSSRLTRGFFVNSWDVYKEHIPVPPVEHHEELKILDSFICELDDGFSDFFDVSEFVTDTYWQKLIQNFLVDLMLKDYRQEGLQRRLLYSITNLYISLFDSGSATNFEKKIFNSQVEAAYSAAQCKIIEGNPLIEPGVVFLARNEENPFQQKFTQLFLYLYRFVDHFGIIDFDKFILKIEPDDQKRLTLSRLLKHWAAKTPFMRTFLWEKLGFKFYQYLEPQEIQIPSFQGSENFVYVFGDRGVGKTHFLYASEYASKQNPEMLKLSVENIDSPGEVENNRDEWREGQELFSSQSISTRLRSEVCRLSRLTLYDIPGTELANRVKIRSWLENYSQSYRPCAIILLFAPDTDNIDRYYPIVDLLKGLAKKDEGYKAIPLYFVTNKSDLLLSTKPKNKLLKEFEQYLSCNLVAPEQEFKIFSPQYKSEITDCNHILKILEVSDFCYRNLAFFDQIEKDIKRVAGLVDELLTAGLSNLSFAYTSSLFDSDYQYRDLQKLWTDLNNSIVKSTLRDRQKYYQREFEDKLDRDLKAVEWFFWAASINNINISLDKEKLESYIDDSDSPYQMAMDFQKIVKSINEDLEKSLEDILLDDSSFTKIEKHLNKFAKDKEKFCKDLKDALSILLRELGIPYNEKIKNIDDIFLTGIKGRQLTEEEKKLVREEDSKKTVFERLCKFNDRSKEKEYCQLLKNYLPRYPQLILQQQNTEEIKREVVSKLCQKQIEQENDLLFMIEILLEYLHELDDNNDNSRFKPKYICKQYQAKYLLEISRSQHLDVEEFKNNPQDTMSKIVQAKIYLNDAMNNPKKMGEYLIKFNQEYQKISNTVIDVTSIKDIRQLDKRLAAILKLYKKIKELSSETQEKESLKSLSKYSSPQLVVSRINEYRKALRNYKQKHKFLILQERVEYLYTSGWIKDLPHNYPEFLSEIRTSLSQMADDRAIDENKTFNLKERFIDGVQQIRKTQQIWQKKT